MRHPAWRAITAELTAGDDKGGLEARFYLAKGESLSVSGAGGCPRDSRARHSSAKWDALLCARRAASREPRERAELAITSLVILPCLLSGDWQDSSRRPSPKGSRSYHETLLQREREGGRCSMESADRRIELFKAAEIFIGRRVYFHVVPITEILAIPGSYRRSLCGVRLCCFRTNGRRGRNGNNSRSGRIHGDSGRPGWTPQSPR